MTHIIVDGDAVPLDLTVQRWPDTGLVFPGKVKRASTRGVMLHWTGSENPARELHRNMLNRKTAEGKPDPVSVHFAIDQHGVAWQFMDAIARAWHCRAMHGNDWLVGIEMINRGTAITLPSRGIDRALRTETFNGKRLRYLAFTDAQVRAACVLVAALCRAFAVPMVVPTQDGRVRATSLSLAEAARFRGVLGHGFLEPGKPDCGLAILQSVHEYGLRAPGIV